MSDSARIPFIHRTRNKPPGVRFYSDQVVVDMADGRSIAMPLHFFSKLQTASDAQRQEHRLHHVSVDWEALDEGIDMIAMLTGLCIGDVSQPTDALKPAKAAAT